jgi:hypothetical protein
MKTIWKFELELRDEQEILMPLEAKPLHVDVQYGKPYIWALVDPEEGLSNYAFYIFGTGHSLLAGIENEISYLGTFMMLHESMVFHVFVEK